MHPVPPISLLSPQLLRLSPPLCLSLSLSPLLSPQWLRDASWRKQREMGPITALGTESWLINSNSLTNCFFTKNHLSLSHGTRMHVKTAVARTVEWRKKCMDTQPQVHVQANTEPHSLPSLPSTHELACPHKRARTHLLSCIYRKGNMLITLEWLIIAQ